jgi:putative tryptophan/tyrosine transport system substrate-binding protein
MRRREFIAGVTLPLLSRATWAQPKKIAQIGFLATGSLQLREGRETLDAFRQGLVELGYVEGQGIAIEFRGADGKIDRFPALAKELVHLHVNVLVATNSLAARAAKQATGTIPIVVPIMGDPVGDGLVSSLARPGGNITGLTSLAHSWFLKGWLF